MNDLKCHCGREKAAGETDCVICRELRQGPEAADREAALRPPKSVGPTYIVKEREKAS